MNTRLLASVQNRTEALLALQAQVDIIDLKQPAQGALGALPLAEINAIVQAIAERCPLSATIGDLPLQAELIANAVQDTAETGVNYVKIGFFPEGDAYGVIERLARLTTRYSLIAVFFADTAINTALFPLLAQAGFKGIMLDTMNKQAGSLTQLLTAQQLADYVNGIKAQSLLCGLAGSLKVSDIPLLLPYQVDYLGFRTALCYQQNRTAELNQQAIQIIKQALFNRY